MDALLGGFCHYVADVLPDRAHGNEFSTQFEESCLRLEELVKGVEKKQQDQANLLEILLISEYFYDEQNREARIVANVRLKN